MIWIQFPSTASEMWRRLALLSSLLLLVRGSNDYDFHEVDEMLATSARNQPWSSRSLRADRPSALPLPDSAIGYEVECGLREGKFGVASNEDSADKTGVGQIAVPGEFPWQVSLQLRTGWLSRHICSGTILSRHWIVSAGHCVVNLKPKALTVVAGEHDLFRNEGAEQRLSVVRIVNGGYQEGGNFAGDIALLQIDPPLQLGVRVAPVCLPQSTKKYESGNATVSGWGKFSERGDLPHILHYMTLPLVPHRHCQELYDSAGYGQYINKACQICGGYDKSAVDSCQGDSGGPLVCRHTDRRYYLCGIVSWGVSCARSGLPGVYTETPCYIDWIKAILYNANGFVASLPPYNPN